MSDHEHEIATYLTLDGHVFLAPQYSIAYDRGRKDGGSCPDFVALDLNKNDKRELIIVEVSSASSMASLIERIKEREQRWYNPILRKLKEVGVVDCGWEPTRFLGFVRRGKIARMRKTFQGDSDVAFWAIEDASVPWIYWKERMENGLPR